MYNVKFIDKATGNEITDEMQKAVVALETSAIIVSKFNDITFLSWLGTMIDQWAANNDIDSRQTIELLDSLKGVMEAVHSDLGVMERSI